jgi:hypothetical protein
MANCFAQMIAAPQLIFGVWGLVTVQARDVVSPASQAEHRVHHEEARDRDPLLVIDGSGCGGVQDLVVIEARYTAKEVDLSGMSVLVDEQHHPCAGRVHVIERRELRGTTEPFCAFADGVVGPHEVDVLARVGSMIGELRRLIFVEVRPEIHRLSADQHDLMLEVRELLEHGSGVLIAQRRDGRGHDQRLILTRENST